MGQRDGRAELKGWKVQPRPVGSRRPWGIWDESGSPEQKKGAEISSTSDNKNSQNLEPRGNQ